MGTNTSLPLHSFDSWGTNTSLCLRSFDSWGTNTLVCLRSFDSLGTNKLVILCPLIVEGRYIRFDPKKIVFVFVLHVIEPRNWFQGIDSTSEPVQQVWLSYRPSRLGILKRFTNTALAAWYNNPIPTRFLVPIDCLKIPAQCWNLRTI